MSDPHRMRREMYASCPCTIPFERKEVDLLRATRTELEIALNQKQILLDGPMLARLPDNGYKIKVRMQLIRNELAKREEMGICDELQKLSLKVFKSDPNSIERFNQAIRAQSKAPRVVSLQECNEIDKKYANVKEIYPNYRFPDEVVENGDEKEWDEEHQDFEEDMETEFKHENQGEEDIMD